MTGLRGSGVASSPSLRPAKRAARKQDRHTSEPPSQLRLKNDSHPIRETPSGDAERRLTRCSDIFCRPQEAGADRDGMGGEPERE
eukprot:748820-Hanusia_phi.AAC.1